MTKKSKPLLVLYKGDENGSVIETQHFDKSLFKEQYVQAMKLFNLVCENSDRTVDQNNISNIIAFCGDRGVGKTSCLKTLLNILGSQENEFAKEIRKINEDERNWLQNNFLLEYNKIQEEKLYLLEIIDPAFFDCEHRVLELVIGQMYAELKEYIDTKKCESYQESFGSEAELLKKFQNVKKSLMILEKSKSQMYDALEELDELAAGMKLRDAIEQLFKSYLVYLGKEGERFNPRDVRNGKIVISIDDLDLNMEEGYVMVEQIRKYLCNKYCIILIALKVDQMEQVVQKSLFDERKKDIISSDLCAEMASKYVAKLFPLGNRVVMPQIQDICEYELEIRNHDDKDDVQRWNTTKEAVVQLIFDKTRYLFYNKVNELSAIIPYNLRSFRHLMAMLINMPDFSKGSQHAVSNQLLFKHYFYNVWTDSLSSDERKFAAQLLQYSDITAINNFVVTYLYSRLDEKRRSQDNILTDIFDKRNRPYNISLGDVMYLINFLEGTMGVAMQRLLFFIRSFYSITLCDFYNNVIGELDEQGPALYNYRNFEIDAATNKIKCVEQKSNSTIYAIDERYANTNKLQQFINGSYYTYKPGDLLPKENNGSARDQRSLSAPQFYKFLSEIVKSILSGNESSEVQHQFKLCEFIILASNRVSTKEEKEMANFRQKDFPYYLSQHKNGNTFLEFDIIAPLYNVINIEYAYNRFNSIISFSKESDINTLFKFALNKEWSLLSTILRKINDETTKKFNEIEDSSLLLAYRLGRIGSQTIIRNIDVHNSLLQQMLASRDKISKDTRSGSGNIDRIISFYKNIMRTNIKLYTHSSTREQAIEYEGFLGSMVDMLETYRIIINSEQNRLPKIEKGIDYRLNYFDTIFADSYQYVDVDVEWIRQLQRWLSQGKPFVWDKTITGSELKESMPHDLLEMIPRYIRQHNFGRINKYKSINDLVLKLSRAEIRRNSKL